MAFLGCAYASPFLQYTPEVAAERARFEQLFRAQAALAAAAPDDPRAGTTYHHQATHHHHQQPATTFNHHQHITPKWQGPLAATIPAGLPGAGTQVAETADVAAARDAFLAAYRAQVAATTGHVAPHRQHHQTFQRAPHPNVIPAGPQKWTGPLASTIPAGVNGQITPVQDTPEVAAARSAFFASYNAAVVATRPAAVSTHHHHHQPQQTFARPAPVHHAQARWTGPVAATIPAGLPGSTSQVSQTADVAQATAAFHQAYNAAVAATTGRRY